MRSASHSTWAVAALVTGLVACGFYDAIPTPSDPLLPSFGLPDAGLPNLPDAGSGGAHDDGGSRRSDGGFELPDGGFELPDGGFTLPDGGFDFPDGGTQADAGSEAGPQVFAAGQAQPMELGLTGSHVYWVNLQGATLQRAAKVGGAPELLASRPLRAALQVDEGAPYFVAVGGSGTDALTRLPSTMLYGTALAAWPAQPLAVGALAQNSASVFAETSVGLVQAQKDGSGLRTRLSGSGFRAGLAADDDGLYTSDTSSGRILWLPPELSATTVYVVATVPTSSRVQALHAGGGTLFVALDSTPAGSASCTGVSLLRAPNRGGSLSPLALSPGCVAGLATDATHVYWLSSLPGQGSLLLRSPLGGGAASQLAVLEDVSPSLAVDASHVYWSEPNQGRVMRMLKPQ
jgi:hypothetical protein